MTIRKKLVALFFIATAVLTLVKICDYIDDRHFQEKMVRKAGLIGKLLLEAREENYPVRFNYYFSTCLSDDAPYSWRMALILFNISSDDYVPLDPKKDWSNPYYAPNDQLARGLYQWVRSEGANAPADIYAVTGDDTAFNEIFVNYQPVDHVPEDCILLIDASLDSLHWMEPVDIKIEDCREKLPRSTAKYGRIIVFSDGETWLLQSDTPDEKVIPFLSIEGASKYDRDAELAGYMILQLKMGSKRLEGRGYFQWN